MLLFPAPASRHSDSDVSRSRAKELRKGRGVFEEFFDEAQRIQSSMEDPVLRNLLRDTLATPDQITADLAKGDAAALSEIQLLLSKIEQGREALSNGNQGGTFPASSSRPLTLKGLIAGGTGRTVILGAICYQIATKNMASGFGAESRAVGSGEMVTRERNRLRLSIDESPGAETRSALQYSSPIICGRPQRKPECISNEGHRFGLHNLRHSFGNWAQANQGKETSEEDAPPTKKKITHRGIDA